jgi:hypothetical protein
MQLFTAHRFVAKKLQISGESLRPCGKYFQGNRIYGHQRDVRHAPEFKKSALRKKLE